MTRLRDARLLRLWPLALASLVQVMLVGPGLLRTGYVADDQANSLFHWNIQALGLTFWSATWQQVQHWLLVEGRLYPLSAVYNNSEYEVIHSLVLYKVVLLVWVLLSSFAMGAIFVRMGLGARTAGLIVVITTVLFQFREYNDPILAFAGLMEIMLLETALSVLLFQGWLQHGGRLRIAGSILLYVMAAMTYESAYVFSVIHVVVAIHARPDWRARLRAMAPIVIATAVMLLIVGILRLRASAGSNGIYQPHLEPNVLVPAALKQMSGALPLTYAKFNADVVFFPRGYTLFRDIGVIPVLVGAATAAVAFLFTRGPNPLGKGGASTTKALAAMGLLLWVFAAVPVAMAPRYQSELHWGLSHLPVYVEYFGVAMLGLAILRAILAPLLRRGTQPVLIAALCVVLGAVAAVTYRANYLVSKQMTQTKEYTALASGLEDGLIRDMAPESFLGPIPGAEWQQMAFYIWHAHKRIEVADQSDPRTAPMAATCRPGKPAHWFERSGMADTQYAIVSCRTTTGPALGALWMKGKGPIRITLGGNLIPRSKKGAPTPFQQLIVLHRTSSGNRIGYYRTPRGVDLFSITFAPAAP